MGWKLGTVLAAVLALSGNAYALRPEVIIDPNGVPPAALQAITEAVNAIVRLADDQDGGEINRLRRRARDATLAALATQGYFSPKVTLSVGSDIGGETWDIAIEAGQQAKVASLNLAFTGRIAGPDFAERVETLREEWPLRVGQPFINSSWNRSKALLLDSVGSRDFMLARMSHSAAEVDAERAQVALSVTIDSGPQVRMGPLLTDGLNRVPESLVERYVRYEQGEVYDQARLNRWQQELQSTAFFRGAFVSLEQSDADVTVLPAAAEVEHSRPDFAEQTPSGDASVSSAQAAVPIASQLDPDGGLTLPVQVRVVEAPARRVSASIGVDDSAGLRLETMYRQNVVLGKALTLATGVGVDRLRQRAFADINLPPDTQGRRDSIGVIADRSDIQGLEVTRFALGATRLLERQGEGRIQYETRWGALLAHDHVKIQDEDDFNLPSATGTFEWLRRDVDDKYDPREGNLVALGGGVGVTLDQRKLYQRLRLRAQKWWPIGPKDVLTVRGEAGRVWSDSNIQVPDDFGFRTGGARTVRGYRYQGLGANRGGAIVGARNLLVGSIEYDHYFNERWGMGVFIDAGDAADSYAEMRMAVGYGVGARLRTPAGPLALDLAYGQRNQNLRLHFSLGIAF